MKALEQRESRHVQAAKSFLVAGNHLAACQHLDRIASEFQFHPDVLEVRWAVQSHARAWQASLETAQRLVAVAPERPTGWIQRSFVLHKLKRTREALDALFPAAEKFPGIPIIRFNLACYAAQLACLWEAECWLKQALEFSRSEYKKLALQHEDLKPLWEKIQSL